MEYIKENKLFVLFVLVCVLYALSNSGDKPEFKETGPDPWTETWIGEDGRTYTLEFLGERKDADK